MDADVHPLVRRAADGVLPDWARADASRRSHMTRVAELLAGWADGLALEPAETTRWRALGFLHDALRDAEEPALRTLLGELGKPSHGFGSGGAEDPDPAWAVDWTAFALPGDGEKAVRRASSVDDLPGPVLHGPATALRLVHEGVTDAGLLSAVAYHTPGNPALGAGGRALYCADYLDPARPADDEGRAALRERYPDDPEGVLRTVLRDRVRYLLEEDLPIFLGTVRMWNQSTR